MKMTQQLDELRIAARRAAIERAEKEYKLQCDVFDTADRKAQATTTIAGALLAADLGFVAKLSDTPSLLTQLVLASITIALGASVLLALIAMFARDSELPASGKETELRYKSLMGQPTPEMFAVMEIDLHDFLLDELKQANESVSTVSGKKAQWVHRAQIALCAAAAVTIVLTLSQIWWPSMLTLKSDAAATAAAKQAPVAGSEADPLKSLRLNDGATSTVSGPSLTTSAPSHSTSHKSTHAGRSRVRPEQ
jgi:hypothetical protein